MDNVPVGIPTKPRDKMKESKPPACPTITNVVTATQEHFIWARDIAIGSEPPVLALKGENKPRRAAFTAALTAGASFPKRL